MRSPTAPVIDATKRGVPENWDGAFNLFPLPNLLGDGVLYAVDFRAMSNIDSSYLQRGNRIKSLSRWGWSLFLMRFVLSATRGLVPLSVWDKIGAALWDEVELWDQWCTAGGAEAAFQEWLDTVCPHLGGFTRRQLLHRGQRSQVAHDLEETIVSRHHPTALDDGSAQIPETATTEQQDPVR